MLPPAGRPIRAWQLRIVRKSIDGVPVLELAGRVSSRTASELRDAIGAVGGGSCVVVDLSAVDYMSSAGFQALHEAASSRFIIVCSLSEAVGTSFDLAEHPEALTREPGVQDAVQLARTRQVADRQSSRR